MAPTRASVEGAMTDTNTSRDWPADELTRIGAAEELEIAPRRPDGTLRPAVPIWVVRVGDDLYVRSWRGSGGSWFRAAKRGRSGHVRAGGVDKDVILVDADPVVADAVDAAYRDKYARYPSYVAPMVGDEARATTLRLVPA
jgi:hypothetical protein